MTASARYRPADAAVTARSWRVAAGAPSIWAPLKYHRNEAAPAAAKARAESHALRALFRDGRLAFLIGFAFSGSASRYVERLDIIVKEAMRFLDQNRAKPFFLYLPFIEPHFYIEAPEENLKKYKGKFPEKDPAKPYRANYADD